jgi:tetratricopeptide (TPR) repeat protein
MTEMRRKFITFVLSVLLAGLACASTAWADAVVLKDGTRIEGDVKRTEGGWTVTSPDGKSTDLAADDVRTIEVGGAGKTNAAESAENLASLRRSVEAIASPAEAIERYRRFLDQNKGTPSIDDAKSDMAVWQDRLDRGLVKVGAQWVTPAQKSEMASQATTVARQAVDLLKQGRTNEAEPVIQQALDADPQNAAALYLRGVMLYGQAQLVAARKAFESVIATLPAHAPSANDLAIILWKQNQQMGAMRYYEAAIIASPVNKLLLDNVAEALAALPQDQRRNPIAVRVFHRFTEQDAQLQTIMAQTGWHRWGSTWVDQATLDKLKGKEQEIDDQIKKDEDAIAGVKSKIADIDAAIDSNTRAMTQMSATSMTRDAKGNLYQAPMPGSYYTMQSDNERLTADRAVQEAKIQTLADDEKKVRQTMPVPQFTGIQRLIGAEGTPFPPSTAPSTAPMTTPGPGPTSMPVMMPLP